MTAIDKKNTTIINHLQLHNYAFSKDIGVTEITKASAGYLDGYGDAKYMETLPTFHMPQLSKGTFRCFEIQEMLEPVDVYDRLHKQESKLVDLQLIVSQNSKN